MRNTLLSGVTLGNAWCFCNAGTSLCETRQKSHLDFVLAWPRGAEKEAMLVISLPVRSRDITYKTSCFQDSFILQSSMKCFLRCLLDSRRARAFPARIIKHSLGSEDANLSHTRRRQWLRAKAPRILSCSFLFIHAGISAP